MRGAGTEGLDGGAMELQALRERVAYLEREAASRTAAEEKLRLVLDQMPFVVWTIDHNLRFTSSSGSGLHGLKLKHGEVVGMSLFDYFQTEDRSFHPIACHMRALAGESFRYENQWSGRNFLVSICPLRNPEGEITGALGAALDVTERKRAEQRSAAIVEAASDFVFTHDLDGRLLTINSAGERLLGYSRQEASQLRFWDLIPSDQRALAYKMFQSLLSGEDTPAFELTLMVRSGDRTNVEISMRLLTEAGRPVGVLGVARDVAERKRMEEQLRQSQKMEAIGTLAGGIAHDFNNLLTGIIGYGYLLKQDLEDTGNSNEALAAILQSAERAAQLTAQLLGFARRGKNQNSPVDIHATLDEVIHMLGRTIDKKITIVRSYASGRPHVKGDPTQIYQIFLNLGLNARDAMPDGGQLRFSTRESNGELVISVSDTGTGIAREIQERIFDPFFTTKPPDKGSGMGLAMVYGIVKNHGGAIRVHSEGGSGTSMDVSLPLCAEQAVVQPQAAKPARGRGTILVVDDEDVVRHVLQRMLQELGYEVVAAADGVQALSAYREQANKINLVILDMVMPRMNGRECFTALRDINPKVRAVLSTGYGQDGAAQEIINEGIVAFLQKPYRLSQLAEVVRQGIEAAPEAAA